MTVIDDEHPVACRLGGREVIGQHLAPCGPDGIEPFERDPAERSAVGHREIKGRVAVVPVRVRGELEAPVDQAGRGDTVRGERHLQDPRRQRRADFGTIPRHRPIITDLNFQPP